MDGGRWSPGIWQNHHLTVKTITKNPIHPTFVRLFTLVINRNLFTFMETLKFKKLYEYIISGFGIGLKEGSCAFGCPFTNQIVFLKRPTWKHLSYGSPVVKNGKLFDKSPKFNMSNREVKNWSLSTILWRTYATWSVSEFRDFILHQAPPPKKNKLLGHLKNIRMAPLTKHPETIPLQIDWDLDFFDSLDGFLGGGKAPHSKTSIYRPMFWKHILEAIMVPKGVPVTPSFWTGGLDHFFPRGRP